MKENVCRLTLILANVVKFILCLFSHRISNLGVTKKTVHLQFRQLRFVFLQQEHWVHVDHKVCMWTQLSASWGICGWGQVQSRTEQTGNINSLVKSLVPTRPVKSCKICSLRGVMHSFITCTFPQQLEFAHCWREQHDVESIARRPWLCSFLRWKLFRDHRC